MIELWHAIWRQFGGKPINWSVPTKQVKRIHTDEMLGPIFISSIVCQIVIDETIVA